MKPKRMMSYHSRALPSPAAKTAFLTRALSALDSTADALIAHLFTVSEDACAFARHPDRRDPAGTRIYQLMSLTRGPHCAYDVSSDGRCSGARFTSHSVFADQSHAEASLP